MNALYYQVVANTETLVSYRQWSSACWAKGQVLINAAIVPLCFGGSFLGRALVRPGGVSASLGGVLVLLGLTLTVVGLVRVIRFRQIHPWVSP